MVSYSDIILQVKEEKKDEESEAPAAESTGTEKGGRGRRRAAVK